MNISKIPLARTLGFCFQHLWPSTEECIQHYRLSAKNMFCLIGVCHELVSGTIGLQLGIASSTLGLQQGIASNTLGLQLGNASSTLGLQQGIASSTLGLQLGNASSTIGLQQKGYPALSAFNENSIRHYRPSAERIF